MCCTVLSPEEPPRAQADKAPGQTVQMRLPRMSGRYGTEEELEATQRAKAQRAPRAITKPIAIREQVKPSCGWPEANKPPIYTLLYA